MSETARKLSETPRKVSETARKRAAYANGERKRAEIVDAALAVFAEKGFRRFSLRQIAEELGTTHVSLRYHFGTKDALLEAVLAEREERDRPWREQVLREKGLFDGVPEVIRRNATRRGVVHLDATLQAEGDRAGSSGARVRPAAGAAVPRRRPGVAGAGAGSWPVAGGTGSGRGGPAAGSADRGAAGAVALRRQRGCFGAFVRIHELPPCVVSAPFPRPLLRPRVTHYSSGRKP